MKTAKDPRHQLRITAVKELFASSFQDQSKLTATTKAVLSMSDQIDKIIEEAAPAWPIDKLNKVDLAILRLAVYEMKQTKTPHKVIIDEAIEIAKTFGSESSASFVNGVLGTIYTKYHEKRN